MRDIIKMNKSLMYRFYKYQIERFPFAILIFTTFSIVLGSFVIVLKDFNLLLQNLDLLIIGTIICLLYTFHIRVLDEIKDNSFDNEFHKERPVQRGLISLKELKLIDKIFLLAQIFLLIFINSITPIIFWISTLLYSQIAKQEFFLKNMIRNNFMIYNLLNLLQMFFLQMFLYSLLLKSIEWTNPFLYVHFIYVLGKIFLVEVGRKLKVKKLENKGKDTYSARYGIKNASFLYIAILIFTTMSYFQLLNYLGSEFYLYVITLILVLIQLVAIYFYLAINNKKQIRFVEISTLLYYISTDILLVFTII